MFKKILKGTLKVLGVLVALVLVAYAYITISLNQRFSKAYAIEPPTLRINPDSSLLSSGAHLYRIKGCEECHGADLGGKLVFEDPMIGRFAGANITYGKGGLPKDFGTQDWVRAIRHGIGKDQKPLLIMPSQDFYTLSDRDVAALIAYCTSKQPVDRTVPGTELGPMGKALAHFDKIKVIPAEEIDHTFVPVKEMLPEASADYGKYLAVTCSGCHSTTFKGGEPQVPGAPPVPDITSSGRVGKWQEAQFIKTLRTGKTPDGRQLKNEDMPWQMTKNYTDTELKALFAFLQSQ